MTAIDVDGTVSVGDLLRALGLEAIPDGCELSLDDEVEIPVTADADELRYELTKDDGPETVPLHLLRDAVTALRDGNARLASVLFDSVFEGCLSPEMGVIEPLLLQRRAA
jgi:hypothetical protein